jgi:hypothetical protein
MALTASQKLALKEGIIIILLRGYSPEMQLQYAYVAVRGDQVADFRKALLQPTFVLDDYGIILESGTGEPTPEVMQRMERDYTFNHAGMLTIDTSNPTA